MTYYAWGLRTPSKHITNLPPDYIYIRILYYVIVEHMLMVNNIVILEMIFVVVYLI